MILPSIARKSRQNGARSWGQSIGWSFTRILIYRTQVSPTICLGGSLSGGEITTIHQSKRRSFWGFPEKPLGVISCLLIQIDEILKTKIFLTHARLLPNLPSSFINIIISYLLVYVSIICSIPNKKSSLNRHKPSQTHPFLRAPS